MAFGGAARAGIATVSDVGEMGAAAALHIEIRRFEKSLAEILGNKLRQLGLVHPRIESAARSHASCEGVSSEFLCGSNIYGGEGQNITCPCPLYKIY